MNWSQSHAILCLIRRELIRRPMQSLTTCQFQTRSIFGFGKKKTESIEPPKEVMESLSEVEESPQLTEKQVMKIRDKSRLPKIVRAQLRGQRVPRIKFLYQMKRDSIRRHYAQWGKASGLKPGIMWPAKDELEYIKGYEKAFCPPFNELVADLQERKELEAKTIRDRENEVMDNLKKLPQFKKEFWQKYHKMHDDIHEEKIKKEKLIQEVREFVGYDLDPKDPRFEEALLKKDEERKKLLKAQRKQEKARLQLERLQTLANEAMEREEHEKKQNEKKKTNTKSEQKADKTSN